MNEKANEVIQLRHLRQMRTKSIAKNVGLSVEEVEQILADHDQRTKAEQEKSAKLWNLVFFGGVQT